MIKEKIYELIRQEGLSEVLTDSRSLTDPSRAIFFALRTDTNDGHNYIPELLQKGVRAFVVEIIPEGVEKPMNGSLCRDARLERPIPDEGYNPLINNRPTLGRTNRASLQKGDELFVNPSFSTPSDATFIVVDNPLEALQQVAAEHRKHLKTKMIAITGSRGKTMVKEWLADTLSRHGATGRSPRSFNSKIGVPLSLLSIRPTDEYAVIEAGVSRAGEMDTLRQIIQPEVVILTGVDEPTHAEGFCSTQEKIAEKLSLAQNARAIIFPAELEDAAEKILPPEVMKISVSIPPQADWMERDSLLMQAALRLLHLPFAPDAVRPLHTRLNVSQGVNNCLIIADRFTCDARSLPSALDFMRRRVPPETQTTLILDELRGEADYQEIARTVKGIDQFIGIGAKFKENADRFPANSIFLDSANELNVTDFANRMILAKGEEGGSVAALAERLQARHHETVLEVNLDAIVHNFNHFRAMVKPTTGMVAMVKASGYGAGAYELARTLQSQGAAYLAVAVVDEGEELRRAGITMPIMALNPKVTNYDSLFANRLEPEVFSFDMLEEIIREAAKLDITAYPIHVKFDTGMHRLGFLPQDIPALCRRLKDCREVTVSSVFSHLATADCLDMDSYTLEQLNLFTDICEQMRQGLGYPFKRHILNSAGIARFPQWQFELVRLGIGLYGVDTINIPQTKGLRTVSTLRSIIISLKHWPAGTAIGYGRRTILQHDAAVATVPVGYADGLDRHLGNGVGKVLINGVLCPIVGNVCMDACMIDVTDAPAVAVGSSVEFFGENLPVDAMSDALGTIPYEILTSVSPRVKRVYYRE